MINFIVAMLILVSTVTLSGGVYFLLSSRRTDKAMDKDMGVLASIGGLVALILGIVMVTTYPINVPNTPLYLYNEQFGIPIIMFGTISIMFGISFLMGYRGLVPSVYAFFASLFNLRYAYNFLQFKLTREPNMAFLLYLFASISGILLPFYYALVEDKRKAIGYLLGIVLFITGIIAGLIAFGAIEGHIAEALKG